MHHVNMRHVNSAPSHSIDWMAAAGSSAMQLSLDRREVRLSHALGGFPHTLVELPVGDVLWRRGKQQWISQTPSRLGGGLRKTHPPNSTNPSSSAITLSSSSSLHCRVLFCQNVCCGKSVQGRADRNSSPSSMFSMYGFSNWAGGFCGWSSQTARLHQSYARIFFLIEGDLRSPQFPYHSLLGAVVNSELRPRSIVLRCIVRNGRDRHRPMHESREPSLPSQRKSRPPAPLAQRPQATPPHACDADSGIQDIR